MKPSVTPSYLKRQLSLDPRTSAERIIALRASQFAIEPTARATKRQRLQTAEDVESARQAIGSIRQGFWSFPIEELQSRLDAIDLEPYPELVHVVEQLKRAASCRHEFDKLASRLGHDLKLFQCLKQAVTLPPRDVAGMREAIMRNILSGDNSTEPAALIIRKEYPNIYALYPEWIDEILQRNPLRVVGGAGTWFGVPIWVYIILLWLILIVWARFLK
jgi:hypothetical protein